MTASYPVTFRSMTEFGGGLMPMIRPGDVLTAYQEGRQIVAVVLDGRFFEPSTTYYAAPLQGSLQAHIISAFSPVEMKRTKYFPGEYEEGVWRPGFLKDTFSDASSEVVRADKQSLFLLVAKMNDILLTIEPTTVGLKSHGARIRELHLLACMEVENHLRRYLVKGRPGKISQQLTTADYFLLKKKLQLGELGVHFSQYGTLKDVRPFAMWQGNKPTQSLTWYDAYNHSKHNRQEAGHRSTLIAAIIATAGALILFVVRYGLRELFDGSDQLSAQIRSALYINLNRMNFSNSYVPRINVNETTFEETATFHSRQAWKKKAFIL